MLTKLVLAFFCVFGFSQLTEKSGFLISPHEQNLVEEQQSTLIIPHKRTDSLGMELQAKSAIVIDQRSGRVLLEKNSQENLPMASLTKMMTATVVLESGVNLDEAVLIDEEVANLEGADIDLLSGEEVRVVDLLHGLLIASGNDAALALAKKIGGGSTENFVAMMNHKAQAIGLTNTHFVNPSGLDQTNHYSNVRDLALLASYADRQPLFNKIVQIKEYDFSAVNLEKNHHLVNTNKLLRSNYAHIKGGKTGYTEEAGFCLTTFAANAEQHSIVVVVLGDQLNGEQFQDTKALVEWVFNNYLWL